MGKNLDDEENDIQIVNGKIIGKENIYEKAHNFEKEKIIEEEPKVILEEKIEIEEVENRDNFKEELNVIFTEILNEEKDLRNDNTSIEKKGRVKNIDGFYKMLLSSGKSKQTIETYKYSLNWWEKIADRNNCSIYKLKLEIIENALTEIDVNTKKKKVSALKQLGKWYLREGYANLNLETQKIVIGRGKVRLPKAKSEEEFIDIKDHGKKLLEEGKREGVWILLMIVCGLRISEIETVEVGKDFVKVLGKGNKERKIPCPSFLIEAMKKIKADGTGGYKSKRQVIDRNLRKIGYSKLHSLRHTYATILHHRGLNIEEVSKLLGHSDISTTQIYAQTKINERVASLIEED